MAKTIEPCSCPFDPDHPDYGQGWTFSFESDEPMKCMRCGGVMRPEQDRFYAEGWTKGMDNRKRIFGSDWY